MERLEIMQEIYKDMFIYADYFVVQTLGYFRQNKIKKKL